MTKSTTQCALRHSLYPWKNDRVGISTALSISFFALLSIFTLVPAFAASDSEGGYLYVTTNKAEGNTVTRFRQIANGNFKEDGEFSTGGMGTGDLEIPALKKDSTDPLANGDDPLISAYGLIATHDEKHLIVSNPGDASISLMRVEKGGDLTFVNKVATSDRFPVSVASTGKYVVSAAVGEDNNHGSIGAYMIGSNGKLTAIPNSRRDLATRPSSVQFSPDGDFLVVTELVSSKIKAFGFVDGNLTKEPVSVIDSPRSGDRFQAIPVGLDMVATSSGANLMVAEARFLTPEFTYREEANVVPQTPKYSWQTSSLSSYTLDTKGSLQMVNGDMLTGTNVEGGEIANCWVVISPDGGMLWVANALSSSISTFSIEDNGSVELMDVTAYKDASEMLFFSDLAINSDGTQLYQLIGNRGAVIVFDIGERGSLSKRQMVGNMPNLGSFGLVYIEQ